MLRVLVIVAAVLLSRPVSAGPLDAPWMGVMIAPGKHGGVLVTQVIPGTPAAHAGLLDRDEILAVDRIVVRSPLALQSQVRRKRLGSTVHLLLRRAGGRIRLAVGLARRPTTDEILANVVGLPAPGFDVPLLTGTGSGSLAELHGNVVVLHYFQTRSAVSTAEHDRLSALVTEHAGDGLVVIGLSRESEVGLRDYATRRALNFPLAQDPGEGPLSDLNPTGASPVIVVIDRLGLVRYAGASTERRQPSSEQSQLNLDHAVLAAEHALRQPTPR
jgi:peroxiredoxin